MIGIKLWMWEYNDARFVRRYVCVNNVGDDFIANDPVNEVRRRVMIAV